MTYERINRLHTMFLKELTERTDDAQEAFLVACLLKNSIADNVEAGKGLK